MLSEPQTINAVSCPRTSQGVNQGEFTSADGTSKFRISHTYGKRTRRMARYDFKKIAPDPLISATNIEYAMSAYLVMDVPVTGFTVAEAVAVAKALITNLTASTDANLTKIAGGES